MINMRRWYPQQQGGLTIPFYTNAFTLRTALPAALFQPKDGKNLVPHVFCSSWSRNLRNRQNPSKPGTPKPSKPQPFSEPRNPSKPGNTNQNHGNFPNLANAISGTWNLRKTSPIENQNQFPEPTLGPGTCRNPSKPRTTSSGNPLKPRPVSFPEPPQHAQNTPKSILCKDPIALCCWGKTLR